MIVLGYKCTPSLDLFLLYSSHISNPWQQNFTWNLNLFSRISFWNVQIYFKSTANVIVPRKDQYPGLGHIWNFIQYFHALKVLCYKSTHIRTFSVRIQLQSMCCCNFPLYRILVTMKCETCMQCGGWESTVNRAV